MHPSLKYFYFNCDIDWNLMPRGPWAGQVDPLGSLFTIDEVAIDSGSVLPDKFYLRSRTPLEELMSLLGDSLGSRGAFDVYAVDQGEYQEMSHGQVRVRASSREILNFHDWIAEQTKSYASPA